MFEALKSHRAAHLQTRITDLMSRERAQLYRAQLDDLVLDYAKTTIDDTALNLLLELPRQAGLEARRDAMFAGEKINETEGRAVLHTALRAPADAQIQVDGADVVPQVQETLDRMERFATAIRSGAIAGQGGAYTDIINIGIGGSDLGPVMAHQALAPFIDGPRCHFVSNVDPSDIALTLAQCDPARTLVIVASKTFTTIETMTNAQVARDWMAASVADPARQFAALSSATEKTAQWGIPAEHVFGFEDWVGGRYSVWGPIGLSVMIATGPAHFRAFLDGGAAMDAHFRSADLAQNLPVLHALVGLWHHQICGYPTRAVLPYDNLLARFPAYLQQMEMESNGKGVTMDGTPAAQTGPVVWGEPGTNGQHAFYQLIHQGTQVVPCEFLVAARTLQDGMQEQHRLLVANCLAQSEALMRGRDLEAARAKVAGKFDGAELERQAAHRVFPGNRPSVTLAYDQLTPRMLGMLVALYEHRVFVEGVILGINSYDQWGVELGKELALQLAPAVNGDETAPDGSTGALISHLRGLGL